MCQLSRWLNMTLAKADDYRRKAEEADQKAKECRDPEARRAYEEAAREFLKIAEELERPDNDEGGLLIEIIEAPKRRN